MACYILAEDGIEDGFKGPPLPDKALQAITLSVPDFSRLEDAKCVFEEAL